MSPLTVRPRRAGSSPRGRGQSLVEFALILPLFLVILGGILDFGFMLNSRITVVNAVREGARVAVNQIKTPYSIPGSVTTSVNANAPGLVLGNLTVTTSCVALPANHATCDFLAGALKPDPLAGDSVLVSATYVYSSFMARLFGSTNIPLSASVQMVLEAQ